MPRSIFPIPIERLSSSLLRLIQNKSIKKRSFLVVLSLRQVKSPVTSTFVLGNRTRGHGETTLETMHGWHL